MRTPVCTRSTSSFGSSVIRTNVPQYIGTIKFSFQSAKRGFNEGKIVAATPHSRVSKDRVVYNRLSPFHRSYAPENAHNSCLKGLFLAFDENVYELRRQKLKQIEALGQAAYRSKFDLTHSIPEILAEYLDKTAEQLENPRINVRVAGRIMAIRLMGKAGFSHLQQGGERLQI